MRYRQVHLDFHTSEKIESIGEHFSKENFQEALRKGHIDSVTVFSKCHHGWAYHPSKANEMHPGLKFDLLKAQIDAAHEIGVKTPVYLSAGLDEKIAVRHPEWVVRNKDESTYGQPDYSTAGWHKLCLNSPYLDYFLNQIEEVCENYDADGIFTDIVWVQPCYCHNCRHTLEQRGLDPYDEKNVLALAEEVFANYTKKVREAVDKFKPGLPIFHNGGHIRQGRRDLAHMNTHIEIESLPTGGWGYDHFPLSASYAQNLGMEYLGMTGKFHKAWGEFGGFKHPNALKYETALNNAFGAATSVGDQLSPDGEMDMVTYELIGEAYSETEKVESWLSDTSPVTDIGVFSYESSLNLNDITNEEKVSVPDRGVCRILLEGKYQFSVLDIDCDFNKYKVIILPDMIAYNDRLYEKLTEFCRNGGKILASGKSGLNVDKTAFVFDFGAKYSGENPYCPDYVKPAVEIAGLGNTGYVIYSKGEKIELDGGYEIAKRENPYFNRTRNHFCSHLHTPDSKSYGGPGITEGKNGIYISWQIFSEYANVGSYSAKCLVVDALNRLMGNNKSVVTDLPSLGIAKLWEKKGYYILHTLYATPVKRGTDIEVIEDIIPVYNTFVSIKAEDVPKRVFTVPDEEEIKFTYNDGRLAFVIPKIEVNAIVVIEF